MKFKLELKSVSYAGKSVGQDIGIEIKILEKILRVDKRIRHGSTVEIDKEISVFHIDDLILEAPVQLKITERDLLFSDVGKIDQRLKIDGSRSFPQKFEYKISVQERRKFFWKSTAIFTVVIEAEYAGPKVDNPTWTGNFRDDSPEMILARAMFGEARGTSDEAKTAVGWVIRNRVKDSRQRWGKTYHDAILFPEHFSAFNQGDPNRLFVENPLHTGKNIDKAAWLKCYDIATQVIDGEVSDPTHGANHYYDKSISNPPWATQTNFKIKIGPFYFHEL